jgi:hypothetical protein
MFGTAALMTTPFTSSTEQEPKPFRSGIPTLGTRSRPPLSSDPKTGLPYKMKKTSMVFIEVFCPQKSETFFSEVSLFDYLV